jgi:hypothetical protein
VTVRQIVKFKRYGSPKADEPEISVPEKNNQKKNEEKMDERVNKAEEIMNNMKAANHVKVVKKDKGLIERTESSKIVLTEDNRQVLND